MIREYEGKELAKDYDKLRPPYPQKIRDEILKCLEKNAYLGVKKDFMLDVGCGGGKSTELFVQDFDNILGIDISEAQIEAAKRAIKLDNVHFKLVHDNLFPVESNSVDFVLCATAIHYLNLNTFLEECDRVLVEGGCVAIILYRPNILKSLDGEIICQQTKKSRYQKAVSKYFRQCRMNDFTRKSLLTCYESIFNDIESPTKRWLKGIHIDGIWTIKEFIDLYSTVAGYSNKQFLPSEDPLTEFKSNLRNIFEDQGMEFEDHTKFIASFEYQTIVIEKTNLSARRDT